MLLLLNLTFSLVFASSRNVFFFVNSIDYLGHRQGLSTGCQPFLKIHVEVGTLLKELTTERGQPTLGRIQTTNPLEGQTV